MNASEIMHVNWVSLVEQNAGFAIAFAILLMGAGLAFAIIKTVGKHVATLQDLIGNHMVTNAKAMKELCMSIKEHRKDASRRSEQILTRADRTLEKIIKIEGKVGG